VATAATEIEIAVRELSGLTLQLAAPDEPLVIGRVSLALAKGPTQVVAALSH